MLSVIAEYLMIWHLFGPVDARLKEFLKCN